MPAPFSGWEMLAAQWVPRELWQPLKPIQNQKAEHWSIALQHNYGFHSDKARGAAIMEHICRLVIWVPRCPLLVIWTRINKPFSVQQTWNLYHTFSLEREEWERNKQVALDLSKGLCKRNTPWRKVKILWSFSLLSCPFPQGKKNLIPRKQRVKQNLEAILQMCPVPNELNTLLLSGMQSAVVRLNLWGKKKTIFTNHPEKLPALPLLHSGNLEKQIVIMFTHCPPWLSFSTTNKQFKAITMLARMSECMFMLTNVLKIKIISRMCECIRS